MSELVDRLMILLSALFTVAAIGITVGVFCGSVAAAALFVFRVLT